MGSRGRAPGGRGGAGGGQRTTSDAIAVFGALLLAVAIAALVALLFRGSVGDSDTPKRGPTSTTTGSRERLPSLEVLPEAIAVAGVRIVPPDILRTSTAVASPREPQLRLKRTVVSSEWEGRRAEIEDRVAGDVRAYAIGDLLPHGSLLVGVSAGAADVMVGDTYLVRLHADGRVEPVEDLSHVEVGPLAPSRDLDPEYADRVRLSIIALRGDDPSRVQAAIDELIASGDPAVEILMPHVDSLIPVQGVEYAFPSGGDVDMRPHVVGEVVMLILERITGQTFGDVTKDGLTGDERRTIARAWSRWWGE